MRENVDITHHHLDSSEEDENGDDDGDDTGIIDLGEDGDAEDGEGDVSLYPSSTPGRHVRAIRNGNVTMLRHGPGRRNGVRGGVPHSSNANSASTSASGSGTSSASGSGVNLTNGMNVDRRGASSPTMSVGSDGGATVVSIGTVRGRPQHPTHLQTQPQPQPPSHPQQQMPQQSRQQFINGHVLEGWTGAYNPPAQYTLNSPPNPQSTSTNGQPLGPVAQARQRMLELQFGSASIGVSPGSSTSAHPPASNSGPYTNATANYYHPTTMPSTSNGMGTEAPWNGNPNSMHVDASARGSSSLPPGAQQPFKQPIPSIEEPVFTRGRPGNASAAAAGAVYTTNSSSASTSNSTSHQLNPSPTNISPARSRRSLRTTLSDASALLFGRNGSGSTSGSGNNSPGGISGAAHAAASALRNTSPTPSSGSGSGLVNGTRNGRS